MGKFQIGDRVTIANKFLTIVGECGTIICAKPLPSGSSLYGVRLDHDCEEGNSLGGRCADYHGMWCLDKDIEKITSKKDNPLYKIVILGYDKKTEAMYISGKKTIANATQYHNVGYDNTKKELKWRIQTVLIPLLNAVEKKKAEEIKTGDLVEVTESIYGTPIPKGARGHVKQLWKDDSWIVDFHECYGETPWEIPESKLHKISPYETNKTI
jgi:hypothetical protein